VARGDLPTAFHEAGHVVAAWSRGIKIHNATIVPTPEFQGLVQHASPLRGLRPDYDTSYRVRRRAESAIVVSLAGPEAQRRHSPRSWRSHHGAADFKRAVDLASRFNGSDEAVNAYLDWLAIVTRDEVAVLWPQVETVARALVARRTLTAAEVKSLLASQ
jgi:hypothetical protein